MTGLLIICKQSGTIIYPESAMLVNSDHLVDDEDYSDSKVCEIASEHGTPVRTDYNLVRSIADALWGDDADTEWNSDTINAIADAIRNVRPELAKS
jgi:hypothetical protein